MAERFREMEPNMFLSAAPQCPLQPQYFYLKELIQHAKLDALFIQFYNNIGCDAIVDDSPGDDFNYDAWEDVIAQSDKSRDAKLYIGLQPIEGSSGYVTAWQMQHIICKYQNKKNFGGISLWDLTLATKIVKDGKTYLESAMDVLRHGCKPAAAPPTTAVPTTTMATSSRIQTSVVSASTSSPLSTKTTSMKSSKTHAMNSSSKQGLLLLNTPNPAARRLLILVEGDAI